MKNNYKVEKCNFDGCDNKKAFAKKGMCDYHYAKSRPRKAPKIKPISTKQVDKMQADRALWMQIWDERLHICENKYCRRSLEPFKTKAGLPLSHLFSHRRSKGAAPHLRYMKSNIDLLCPSCHREWETGDRKKVFILPLSIIITEKKKYAINMLMDALRIVRRDPGCGDIRPRQHETSLQHSLVHESSQGDSLRYTGTL